MWRRAEMGVIQPQAKECLQPPEAERGKERFYSRAFWRNTANNLTSDFWPLKLRENKFLLVQVTKFGVICYGSHGQWIQEPKREKAFCNLMLAFQQLPQWLSIHSVTHKAFQVLPSILRTWGKNLCQPFSWSSSKGSFTVPHSSSNSSPRIRRPTNLPPGSPFNIMVPHAIQFFLLIENSQYFSATTLTSHEILWLSPSPMYICNCIFLTPNTLVLYLIRRTLWCLTSALMVQEPSIPQAELLETAIESPYLTLFVELKQEMHRLYVL